MDKEHIKGNELECMQQRIEATAKAYNKKLVVVSNNIWKTRFRFTDSLDYSLSMRERTRFSAQ